jgi:AP-4 complex subunit mu-1
MIDFGYPQITSTSELKKHVYNEPITVKNEGGMAASLLSSMSQRTKSAADSNISIMSGSTSGGKKQKNEIYVDILERISCTFAANGEVTNSNINGSIMMKSFLSGNPELRLALNEDLAIGSSRPVGAVGPVTIDDMNFHECVRVDEFDSTRTLHFFPPDGEFSVLNYRISNHFPVPFRISFSLEQKDTFKLELLVTVKAVLPEGNHGSNVVVLVPMPRAAIAVSAEPTFEIPGSSTEYHERNQRLEWRLKKFNAGQEFCLRVRITTGSDSPITRCIQREVGPIKLNFEVPMFNVSGLQVRYLRISETHKSYNPYRWVRYITLSSNYVQRMKNFT